ncbi:(E2-independent) E3 ubiquitin-conjugating enzyme FATS [Vanacampus margaritifer]
MTLRRPAAHLPMGWRRSGDEFHWETQSSKGESSSHVPRRAARPRSAVEGGQLDAWLRQLRRMQEDGDGDASDRDRRPYRTPSFSGVSSPRSNATGSRESLQSEFFVPVGRSGSLERVRISQTPKREQSQVSCVAPVKSGWLPVQRRVMKAEDSQGQRHMVSPHSAVQVKLKQAITPTFLKSRGTVSLHQDGQAERSQRRTWKTPDRLSPVIKQVQSKQSCTANERPGIWKALRRGWNSNRLSGTRGSQPATEIPSDPHQEFVRRTRVEEPPRSTFTPDSNREATRVEEAPSRSPPAPSEVSDPSRRTSGAPPVAPCRRHSLQPSHIQTTSAATTLIPRTKVGFSSITISSRKVNRSASLTASDRPRGGCTADPWPDEHMDPRKATIVKVTEQRTTVSSAPLVLPRKAAIIKVTEHKERYSPGILCRNSVAVDGKENGTWKHPERSACVEAETTTASPIQNGESAAAAENSGQEPKRPTVRKWSLGLPQESLPQTPRKDHQGAFAARWSSTPCLTLIQTPDPHQSPEEVLALNAAAIIANIKLQRQLSMKKPSEGESAAASPPPGNSAAAAAGTDGGQCTDARGHRDEPRADNAPPTPDLQKSRHTVSLQEALRRSRPRFIARSQERVQKMARRAKERKERSRAGGPQTLATRRQRAAQQQTHSSNDHLFKYSERAKDLKSNRTLTDVKRKKEEEKKKEACLTNRQRVELFKKKLLDQILHRSSN